MKTERRPERLRPDRDYGITVARSVPAKRDPVTVALLAILIAFFAWVIVTGEPMNDMDDERSATMGMP